MRLVEKTYVGGAQSSWKLYDVLEKSGFELDFKYGKDIPRGVIRKANSPREIGEFHETRISVSGLNTKGRYCEEAEALDKFLSELDL